jgi:peptidoglycan-associated lipoprotein
MRMRLLTILAAVLLVTACSSTSNTTGSVSGDGKGSAYGSAKGGPRADVPPGSVDDLVLNVGDRVFFDYDRFDLKAEAKSTLERQASWLKQYRSFSITVEGHADERGTREYNLALGEKRAAAIKDYLTSLGVSASRVKTISYGKERPAVLGSDESSWAQNRRGVTVIQGTEKNS